MPLSGPNGSSEWFAGSWAEHLKVNENKSSATLVEIRESNLSDAGSIPAISTLSPLNGGFFFVFGTGGTSRRRECSDEALSRGKKVAGLLPWRQELQGRTAILA